VYDRVAQSTEELTLMTSADKASLCEPRNRNGRMHVGSTLGRNDEQEATDAGVDNDAGPLPRHSHDDDDDDDDWLRGTEGVEQRH